MDTIFMTYLINIELLLTLWYSWHVLVTQLVSTQGRQSVVTPNRLIISHSLRGTVAATDQ